MTLGQTYKEEIVPKLVSEFGLPNNMAAPKVEKVVVNMGIGETKENKEEREKIAEELAAITGQKPALRPARISIAGFGVRQGQPVGLKVTLRGSKMYAFLDKLFNVVLPRLRDFRGVPRKSFDSQGNYTLGISEHTVFPEIDLGKVGRSRGLEVTIVTDTTDRRQAERLLEELGVPFEKEE